MSVKRPVWWKSGGQPCVYLPFHLRAVVGTQCAHVGAAAGALRAPEGETAGASQHDAEGEEHEEDLKFVLLVSIRKRASKKNRNEHFDAKEEPKDTWKNSEDQCESADDFEPRDE